MLRRGPSTSLLLQTGWQESDLLLLVLAGMQRQGHRSRAAALDRWAAAGAMMLQRQGMQYHGATSILHWALVHPPAGLAAASGLLAVQWWPVLLQRPAMDLHWWRADGLHMVHLHPPPGLVAALLWWAVALRWARLQGLAALRLALAGPLNVMAEAAGVMARGWVCGAYGAFVAASRPAFLAADRAVVVQVLAAVSFLVLHLVFSQALGDK